MGDSLISCDWGLSSFRIRLMAGSALPELRAEHSSDRGIAGLAMHPPEEFGAVLRDAIQALFGRAGIEPEPLPVCLSGMVVSSLGWRQLPYAPLPFPLDGTRALIAEDSLACPWGTHRLFFVSGLASRDDAMRGEECEVVGLFSGSEAGSFRERSVAILPGTHSKHIDVRHGEISDFRTFLTGELYDLLCRHSVLRHSVRPEVPVVADEDFATGVRRGAGQGVLGSLFSVRARDLLEGIGSERGSRYLSGLLIGDEIASIAKEDGAPAPIVLGGSASLQRLYRRGLELLGAGDRIHVVPESRSGCAASLGQWQIMHASGMLS